MANYSKHRRCPRKPNSTSHAIARALVIALFSTQLSLVAASPVPSLPASAPGLNVATVPASGLDASSLDPVVPGTSLDFIDDEADDDEWELVDEDIAPAGHGRMAVDGMGNAIEKAIEDATEEAIDDAIDDTTPQTPPHPPSQLSSIGPLTLPESLLASLSRLFSHGFWHSLLGNFFVFWVLVTATVAALVSIGLHVRRLDRDGRLRKWKDEMANDV